MTALAIEALEYTYAGAAAPALAGVSLEVASGELVLLAGLSGSGKSTLLRACSGLVPYFHGGEFGGRVTVAGRDTRRHGPAALAEVCGSLFQDPETQVVMGTVRAELAFGLENRGAAPAAVAREVEEVALALSIAHLLDRPTHELSGGELQRVALGAALAGRPPVVCLDEPTSQLDPVAGDELIWLVRRLNEQWGTTVLLAEHRLERVLPAADRVVALDRGRVVCDAPPRAFLEWAATQRPALETPAAQLFSRAGLRPPPTGVKQARATLRAHGLLSDDPSRPAGFDSGPGSDAAAGSGSGPGGSGSRSRSGGSGSGSGARAGAGAPRLHRRRRGGPPPALELRDLWCELPGGRTVLRGVDLRLDPGERVALMGRNGAGKSTLLRHVKGLVAPTRGRVRASGDVALLLQHPGDYLVHERVADEAAPEDLARVGLTALAERHPRDLSGGERQRLALAIVTAGATRRPPAVVCLDEPTRGMDREHMGALVALLDELAAAGSAVLVATHDPELAVACAERVVLLGDGRPVADGPIGEVLAGGWYFTTETARVLGGAGGALDPTAGAELLRRRMTVEALPSRGGIAS